MNFAGPFDAELTHDSPVSLGGGRFTFDSKPGFTPHHASDSHVIVPDAHLLFSGDYTRIGSDLIISGDGQKFVVGNYFKGETRPALVSKDGATLSGHIVDSLTGHIHYAQASGAPAAGEVIGHVLKLSGSASAIRNGVSIELHIGDVVQKGDVVQTASDSSIGMTFVDGSAFGMNSNARMVLNEMIYDPNGSSNSSLISLVQGTITFVAGQTAKNGNMRVETPVATMGIRGTAVLVEIGANDGPTKFSVLVEPDGHTGSYNLYDKTTGDLIGTVSQAGQVTFVSVNGIGQPPTALEQLKTLADQQAEKALIQQVFQLFFPNYNPDNSNPKSQKTGFGSPGDNINPFLFNNTTPDNQPIKIIVIPGVGIDPHTGQPNPPRIFFNTKAQFSADTVTAEQSITSSVKTFKISDVVHIDDPDINNGPFFDKATPFVAGSAVIMSAVSTNPNLDANFLKQFLHINQQTGEVTFDRLGFNFLGQGETATFMLQVLSQSGPDSALVTIPIIISGDNDVPNDNGVPNGAPTIVLPLSDIIGGVKEDTPVGAAILAKDGTITFRDVDLSDTHTVAHDFTSSSSSLPGFATGAHIGTFTIDLDPENTTDIVNTGTVQWHFSLPDNDPTLQSLAEGQTITQVYTITITDQHGALVTQTVTVTITGTNDAPVIDTIAATALTEQTDTNALTLATPIHVTFTDVDLSDVGHTASITAVTAAGVTTGLSLTSAQLIALTTLGTVTKAAGSSTGSVDVGFSAAPTAFDYLAANEQLTLTYTIAINDGDGGITPKTFSITVTGTNDAPVIDTIAATSLTEQTDTSTLTLATPIHVTFTDVDLTDVGHTASITTVTTTGITTGLSLNSMQLIALTTLGTVTKASGSSTGSVDVGFSATSTAFDYLAANEQLTLTYTIAINDGDGGITPKTFSITITGTNDVPVIAGVATGSVTEDAALAGNNLVTNGTLTIIDADHDQSSFVAQTATAGDNGYGTFTLDTSGHWTYTANNNQTAIQQLGDGQSLTDTFTVHSLDGTADQVVTVTIHGTNDVPTVTAPLTLATTEGNAPVVRDLLAGASDVDSGETATLSVTNIRYAIDGGLESTTIPHGITFPDAHTINIDAAGIQHIPAGVTETIVVSYDIQDIHGATVAQTETITIIGVNDRPELSAGTNFTTITEDQTTNSGQFVSSFATGITDPDDGAVKGIAITGSSSQNGHWEYSINNGTSWTAFGPYSTSSGLLLALDDKVRFVPDGNHGGSDTLTYVAWDQTSTAIHGQTTPITGGLHSDPFSFGPGQTATLTVTDVNDAPVMNSDSLLATELGDGGVTHPDGTTQVSGVLLSDPDETGNLTFSAVADHGTVTKADGITALDAPGGVSESLVNINGILSNGFIYTPDNLAPTDHVLLTVTDSHGVSDTLNLVFNQSGTSGATLIGTEGKDIFFATGSPDTFVFAPNSNHDIIMGGFAAGIDKIDLQALTSYDTAALTALLDTADHTGGDTLLHLNGTTDTLLLKGVATLNASDFILHA